MFLRKYLKTYRLAKFSFSDDVCKYTCYIYMCVCVCSMQPISLGMKFRRIMFKVSILLKGKDQK